MSEFYITNSLNPNMAVKFNITLRYFVTKQSHGDHVWVLEIGTTYSGADGSTLPSKKTYSLDGSISNIDDAIESSVAELCALIDWSPLVADTEAPHVYSYLPTGSGISISENMYVSIRDNLPSSGIDMGNVKVTLNNGMEDFDITNEIQLSGDAYERIITWMPPLRVYARYS